MNFASIEVMFEGDPEVKTGKSGKSYCAPKAVMIHRDRDGKLTECELRGLIAFGEVAERLAYANTASRYILTCELSCKQGGGQYADRVFMEWVIRGVAEVVDGRKPAAREDAPATTDEESELPF